MGLNRHLSFSRNVIYIAIAASGFLFALCSAKEQAKPLSSNYYDTHFGKRAVLEPDSLRAVARFSDQSHQKVVGYNKLTKRSRLQKRGRHALKDADLERHPWLKNGYGLSTAGDDWHTEAFPKQVMFTYGDLLHEAATDPDTLLLRRENKDRWEEMREKHKLDRVPFKIHQEIRKWFGKNMYLNKAWIYTAFDQIEWNLRRLNSDPVVIWWDHELIKTWCQNSVNWKEMIEIGDALDFNLASQSHTIPDTKRRELKHKLHNLMHRFQGPYKSTNERWGISQSILALKNTIGTTTDLKTLLYDLRVEQILGPLGPGSDLGKRAAKLNPLDTRLPGGDLELHWFLNGLDPADAEKIGAALFLGSKSLGNKKEVLVEEEKRYIRDFYKILHSQYYREGYTEHGLIQDWYIRALGEDEYQRRVHEVKKLYRRIRWSDLWLRFREFFKKIFQKRWWTKTEPASKQTETTPITSPK